MRVLGIWHIFHIFEKHFACVCYDVVSIISCEFKGQLHYLLSKNGNIISENRIVAECQWGILVL